MQTKKGSVAEVAFNLVVGYSINFMANILILPLFGFSTLSLSKNALIGLIFTVISIVRQYVIRRWFNKLVFGNKS